MSLSCLWGLALEVWDLSFESLKASDFITKGIASPLGQFQQKCPLSAILRQEF